MVLHHNGTLCYLAWLCVRRGELVDKTGRAVKYERRGLSTSGASATFSKSILALVWASVTRVTVLARAAQSEIYLSACVALLISIKGDVCDGKK